MDDNSVPLSLIRVRFVRGEIPRLMQPVSVFGGPSDGQMCIACGQPIPKGRVELEVTDARGISRRFHPTCLDVVGLLQNELKDHRSEGP